MHQFSCKVKVIPTAAPTLVGGMWDLLYSSVMLLRQDQMYIILVSTCTFPSESAAAVLLYRLMAETVEQSHIPHVLPFSSFIVLEKA